MRKVNKSKALRKRLLWVEKWVERASFALRRRFGLIPPPLIAPYRGFGNADRLWVRARVIADQGVITAPHSDSTWENIKVTARRYMTTEIPAATIEWRYGTQRGTVISDEEGFVDFTIAPGHDFDPLAQWQTVGLRLIDAPLDNLKPLSTQVFVRTPHPSASLGLISDIDDTIVHTGAFNFIKHWRTVVANSAESRKAFPDVPDAYASFARGSRGEETHPVFYVSSSPWNLFDLFERFMTLNGIPLGPMMLKDFGMTETKWLTGGHEGHKARMIGDIMATYPEMHFLLAGDSGQHDARIYRGIVEEAPQRIAGVWIRDVAHHDPDDLQALKEICATHAIPYYRGVDFREAHDLSCLDPQGIAARRAASLA